MILVLRALGIGDLATAVPALRALRAACPGDVVTLAAPGWLAPLVELTGVVDRHLPVDGLAPRPLPKVCWAVNLHGRGPQSHRLLRAAQPDRLLGFACPPAGHLTGPQWTEHEHEVHRWCRLLEWYGIAADPGDLDLARPSEPAVPAGQAVPAGATVVHVGAKDPARRWPVGRFAAVARELAAAGHQVVVTGSAAELPRAARAAELAGLPGTAVYAGRTGLARLAALVSQATLVVSGDTGVAHLATAYRVPSVVLFGPEPPSRWGPPADRPWHRPVWSGPVRAHVAAVPVEEVLAAAWSVTSAPVTSARPRVPDAATAQ